MSVRSLALHQQPVPVLGYCTLLAHVGLDFQLNLFPLREAGSGVFVLFQQQHPIARRSRLCGMGQWGAPGRFLLGMAEKMSLECWAGKGVAVTTLPPSFLSAVRHRKHWLFLLTL